MKGKRLLSCWASNFTLRALGLMMATSAVKGLASLISARRSRIFFSWRLTQLAWRDFLELCSQLAGIDRIELEELIDHQLVNERSTALFKADKHFTFCTEALVHQSDPIV